MKKPAHDLAEIVAHTHYSGRGRWWVFAYHYILFSMRGRHLKNEQVSRMWTRSSKIAVFKDKRSAVDMGRRLAKLFQVPFRIV